MRALDHQYYDVIVKEPSSVESHVDLAVDKWYELRSESVTTKRSSKLADMILGTAKYTKERIQKEASDAV